MVDDYMKEKTDLNSNLQNIEKTILLDKEIKKIQKFYESIIKLDNISTEEREKIKFGSYTYSTGV